MKATLKVYAAIRRNSDDGHEFIDLSTAGSLREEVMRNMKEIDRSIPDWSYANPVRRVVEVEIKEL